MTIDHFFAIGINYKKTDASIRGQFAVNSQQYAAIIEAAKALGITEIFVISTCNRTEVYGICNTAQDLINLLCQHTVGDRNTFLNLSYQKNGLSAIHHLFAVGAGLDSQILGDYEIIGQIKQAFKFSKEQGCIGAFTERLVNAVLQTSKLIKNNTQLSGGTVSVAFAAIQFLKENVEDVANKSILLLGTGKIGRNTCKNVIDYLNNTNITLINRTEAKAQELANELKLKVGSYEVIEHEIQLADIVIVATNAAQPIITPSILLDTPKKVLIDLSIPNNIDPGCKQLSHITLANVDDLSKINDATLQKREAEVPKANAIIEEQMTEFVEWCEMRKHVPVIKAAKIKLMQMQSCSLYMHCKQNESTTSKNIDTNYRIQKTINNMAQNMRKHNKGGCNFIEAINEFMTLSTN